jgi:hypothetical protein
MSGQLVGEVLDAAEAGQLDKLSRPAFSALLAIAERCHHFSRRGSVSRSRIKAAIHAGNSDRTADRAVRELKDAGLIQVVKRGYESHGEGHANIYELCMLAPPKMAEAPDDAYATQDGGSTTQCASAKIACASAKIACASATQDGEHNGTKDGTKDGKEPPYPPTREQPPPRRITDGRDKALAKIRQANINARSPEAYRLAQAFSDSQSVPIESGVLAEIGAEVAKCLRADIPATAITAGLDAWTHSDRLYPSQIPRFVHKANNGHPRSTSDDRVRQAQALKSAAGTTLTRAGVPSTNHKGNCCEP